MAGQETVPFAPQNAQEVTALIQRLVGEKNERGKRTSSAKKGTFEVSDSPAKLVVDSWRLPDWEYKKGGIPTYARGLFTLSHNGRQEIAIRGYDKFFNVGEVEATKWEKIEKHTKGPYELSLKENGCIIFISGLPDDSLLVCSKHSTGTRSDTEVSHAKAGERWVDKQLKALGRTREELARELRKRNATVVCELCDDDFEEHILAYQGDAAGLYLHGINLNLPCFATYPGSEVQRFADEWGFKRTDFFVMDDILAVHKFLNECAETGTYNGRDIEGFVIRCKSKFYSRDYQDWFFKYKFEEPYLMYRQWRECTKALIEGKTPRYKKHIQITEEYLLFARRRLATDRNLAEAYRSNHGIIALRDEFLKEKNLKGSDIIRLEYAVAGGAPEDVNRDVILVPIATIGCGKTTIALALQHIFGWGHIQNDNITGKNRPPRFTNEVLQQLDHVPVVFADRNNAQRHERKQITEDVHRIHPAAKLIALNYTLSKQNIDQVRQVTQNRVFARGDNHQTIQASSDQKKVFGIMEGFINRFEPFDPNSSPDDAFDGNIDLDPLVDSRQNLEIVVARLHDIYPKIFSEMPSSDDLDDAIKFALSEYKPVIKHDVSVRGPKSKENQNKARFVPS
jgi:tRNA ligase